MVTIDIFRNEADTLAIAAGQTVFKEGNTGGQTMFVVVEGEVDLLVKGRLVELNERRFRFLAQQTCILPCR